MVYVFNLFIVNNFKIYLAVMPKKKAIDFFYQNSWWPKSRSNRIKEL